MDLPALQIQPVNALAPMAQWQSILEQQQKRYQTMAQTQDTMSHVPVNLATAKNLLAQAGLAGAQTGMVGAQTAGQQIQNQLSGYRANWTGQVFGQPQGGQSQGGQSPQGTAAPRVPLPWEGAAPPTGSSYGGETGRDLVTPQTAPGPQSSAEPVPGQPDAHAVAALPAARTEGNALAVAQAVQDAVPAGQPMGETGQSPVPTPAGSQVPPGAFETVSPNGMLIPGMGMPIPRMWSGALLGPDPGKAIGELVNQRRQMLSQMLAGATDPASWNTSVRGAYDQGFLTAGRAWQLYNHFDQRDAVERSLATPESQVGYQSTLASKGFTPGPSGPQANASLLNAQGPIVQKQAVTGTDGQQYEVTTSQPRAAYVQSTTQAGSPAAAAAGQPARVAPAGAAGPGVAGSPGEQPQGLSWQQYSASLAQRESGGNAAVGENPRSSASGLYQFTNAGWLQAFRQAYPEMANVSDQQALAMRGDAAAQQRVLPFYTRDNIAALQAQNPPIPVNAATLALAHQLGPAGEAAVLSAPADAPLARVLPQEVIQANPQFARMRVGDLIQQTKARFPLVPVQMPTAQTGREALGLSEPQGGTPIPAAVPGAPGTVPNGAPNPQAVAAGLPPGTTVGMPHPSPQAQAQIDVQKQAALVPVEAGKAEQTARAGAYGDLSKQIITAGSSVQQKLERLDVLQNAAQDFRPGASADVRAAALHKLVDAIQLAGGTPPDWMLKGASGAEVIGKEGGYLAAEMTKALGSREAASVFNQIRNIQPNLTLSTGGYQAVINSIRQGVLRDRDLATYQDQWLADPTHGNSIKGMIDSFNKLHPVQAYASRVVPYPAPKNPKQLIPNVFYRAPNGAVGLWDGHAFHLAPQQPAGVP